MTGMWSLFGTVYFIAALFFDPTPFWFAFTTLLITVGILTTFHRLYRSNYPQRSLLGFGLLLLGLFGLLHYQLYHIGGEAFYITRADPGFFVWAEMIAVHVFRAVDLVDLLEAYDIHLQHVYPRRFWPGFFLITMHATVDVFLFGALMKRRGGFFQQLDRMRKGRMKTLAGVIIEPKKAPAGFMKEMLKHPDLMYRFLQIRFPLFLITSVCLFFCIIIAVHSDSLKTGGEVNLFNLMFYPAESVLKTIDFADAFQIFDWRLHDLTPGFFFSTVTVFFRFLVGTYLLGLVSSMYFHLSGGRSKSVEECGKMLVSKNTTPAERVLAAQSILRNGPEAACRVTAELKQALCYSDPEVRRRVCEIFQSMEDRAVLPLMEILGECEVYLRTTVLDLLDVIDPSWRRRPDAQSSIASLTGRLINESGEMRSRAMWALSQIDPDWPASEGARQGLMQLTEGLVHEVPAVRTATVDAIGRMGPNAAAALPRLKKALAAEEHPDIKRRLEAALLSVAGR